MTISNGFITELNRLLGTNFNVGTTEAEVVQQMEALDPATGAMLNEQVSGIQQSYTEMSAVVTSLRDELSVIRQEQGTAAEKAVSELREAQKAEIEALTKSMSEEVAAIKQAMSKVNSTAPNFAPPAPPTPTAEGSRPEWTTDMLSRSPAQISGKSFHNQKLNH